MTRIALTAALALAATAAAEPIPTWSYRAQVSATESRYATPPQDRLRTVAGYDTGGRAGIVARHNIRPAIPEYVGQTTVAFSRASMSGTGPNMPANGRDFAYFFEVTDFASGESAAFGFTGYLETTPRFGYEQGPDGFPRLPTIPDGGLTAFTFTSESRQTHRIGDHLYDVEFAFRPFSSNPYQDGDFEATVTPLSVETPEPATAVLAGLAISLTGLGRLARRRRRPAGC